ncbi:MAG TPA: hypothetical protein VM077_01525 [Candidatus Limnocylindrales bacterium]|nr:hypothetical protein [Candidatus Limnocylindrales bacterium]
MRSRLRSNVKKQSIHILLLIIGIIIVVLATGTHLLVGFGVALDMIRGTDKDELKGQKLSYIAPPSLNPLHIATKKRGISINGLSISDSVTIDLYLNGTKVETTKPKKDGSFSFENVKLDEGENEIKAKSVTKDGVESEYSERIKIKYLNRNPDLEISNPKDGQTFKKDQSPIRISGKTDPGAKVSINDFWTIISDDGEFYYMYNLKDGGNDLKVVSTDEAGNTTTKQINIKVE